MAKERKLTAKQERFATEYVKLGNGTKAAIAAGYAAGQDNTAAAVRASEAVRKSNVVRRIKQLTAKYEISAERVLKRLDNLSFQAETEGQYGPAVKAEELIGKSMGMWIDRSVNVNLDLSVSHLTALQQLVNNGQDRITGIMENADKTEAVDNVETSQDVKND